MAVAGVSEQADAFAAMEHHAECERFQQHSHCHPCICQHLEFHAGREVVLAMDRLHDEVSALPVLQQTVPLPIAPSTKVTTEYLSRLNVLTLIDGSGS